VLRTDPDAVVRVSNEMYFPVPLRPKLTILRPSGVSINSIPQPVCLCVRLHIEQKRADVSLAELKPGISLESRRSPSILTASGSVVPASGSEVASSAGIGH